MPIAHTSNPADEFGFVEAVEIRKVSRQGAMRPLICYADDGVCYFVKTFSPAGAWPQIVEWISARIGRKLGLPIPNYRQINICSALADAWNVTGKRSVEAGIGFGSQEVPLADECDAHQIKTLSSDAATQVLSFDWWIRNTDRTAKNPNLLWSRGESRHYLIDHEKAGADGDGADFWQSHILAAHEPWITNSIVSKMNGILSLLATIRDELPDEWTSTTDGISWFVSHL
jgi:hypothetical protein